MPFLIHNFQTATYMVLTPPNNISWTTQPLEAKKFTNLSKANNFLNNNFPACANAQHIDLTSIHVVDLSTLMVDSSTSASIRLPEEQEADNALAALAPASALPLLSPETENDPALSMDDVTRMMEKLPEMIAFLNTLQSKIKCALLCCTDALRQSDKETEDLLHKIEFTRLNVVDGYRLYKELHDCRLERRKAKDLLSLLRLIQGSGLLDNVQTFNAAYSAYQQSLETRVYRPRVRNDLFEA